MSGYRTRLAGWEARRSATFLWYSGELKYLSKFFKITKELKKQKQNMIESKTK